MLMHKASIPLHPLSSRWCYSSAFAPCESGLVRPKVSYEWQDDFKVWVGADVFYGDKMGLFGQFDANDRIIVGMEWGF